MAAYILAPTVVYLVIGTIFACGALPWYFLLKPVNGLLRYEGPLIYLATDIAMFQFLLTVPLGLYVFFKAENFSRQIAGAMLIVTGTLLLFLSHDETIINIFYRSRYLVMMFFYPALVWTIRSLHLAWPTRYTGSGGRGRDTFRRTFICGRRSIGLFPLYFSRRRNGVRNNRERCRRP